MNAFLAIYIIGIVLTLIFASAKNGEEMAYCRVLAPGNVLTPNWVNFFFLGLLWFAYWPQYFVSKRVASLLPDDPQLRQMAAAQAMGMAPGGPRG